MERITSFYNEGDCPIPTIYETYKFQVVIYDSEGNILTQKNVPLGFDLTSELNNEGN